MGGFCSQEYCALALQALATWTQAHSELVDQWHPTKNGGKQPSDVVAGSNQKAWWICPEGCRKCGRPHEWQTVICNRT
jgi:hypothetical protein